jgi:putative transposon-encoded protein
MNNKKIKIKKKRIYLKEIHRVKYKNVHCSIFGNGEKLYKPKGKTA